MKRNNNRYVECDTCAKKPGELDAMPSTTLREIDEKINKAYYLKGYIEALETLTLENHE